MKKINSITKYILIIIPFVFGFIGFAVLEHESILDSVFNTIEMYLLNYGDTPPNIFIEITRWIAPLATATGVLMVAAKLQCYVHNYFVYLKGGSVAVYGPQNEKVEMLLHLGKCGIDGGDRIVKAERYILLGDREWNMNFYHAHSDELHGHPIYLKSGAHTMLSTANIKPFCTEETAARLFWKQPYIFNQISNSKSIKQIIFIGFGELGENLLYWGLLNLIFSPTEKIEYHVFGDGKAFSAVHHGMAQISDPVLFYDTPWYTKISLLNQADLIIVIEQKNQMELLSDILLATTAQCIDVFEASSNTVEFLDGADRLRIFKWKDESKNIKYIFEDTLLKRAKRINLRYSHLYHSIDETDENMELEWQKLNTFTRYSNISCADYHEVRLMMLQKMGIEPIYEKIEGTILDDLSHLEHIRWCRYYYLNNWKHGEFAVGKRTEQALRLHGDLVDYDNLTDSEKEKNRENIRILMSLSS